MRFIASIPFLIAEIAAIVTSVSISTTSSLKCEADNCLRAIRASAFPTRPGTADCSSYFRAIVTPTTVTISQTVTTITVTQTVSTFTVLPTTTAPTTITAFKRKRQATGIPTSIPAYASPCSGSSRYESACSCIGLTRNTITLSTPTTTVSVTVTSTTTQIVATSSVHPFVLQVETSGGTFYGLRVTEMGAYDIGLTASRSDALLFYFNPNDGSWVPEGYPGVITTYDFGMSYSPLFITYNYTPVNCTLDGNGVMTCTSTRFVQFGTYNNNYSLKLGTADTDWAAIGGEAVTVKAVFV
ncbi:hypothetical protein TWF694_004506 [Orbilia ellipsospora]|uniref:Uncharacterized protein n=1 Tax=Orbilia ellipsospora TaxID=2528407 RepID=A0AAV9WXW8_9PEZI